MILRYRRGFTLIEVLITLAIIGIASVVILAGLSTGRSERELEASAREFVGAVREAQNDALTGKQLTPSTIPCQYRLSWSGSQYQLTYFYAAVGGSCASPSSSPVPAYSLSSGVSFSSGASAVTFQPPHATNDLPAAGRLIVFSKGGKFHSVCLYQSGRMSDQAGQLVTCP